MGGQLDSLEEPARPLGPRVARDQRPERLVVPGLEQVDQLLLAEGFNGRGGWQCSSCRVLGLPPTPAQCPFCGTPMPEEVDLRDAMVRRAQRTGRRIEIVEGHPELESMDGAAALLRYRV